MKRPMTLTVNGIEYETYANPGRNLRDCLRLDLGMTGTKEVCDDGYCGACTVIIDGVAVKSCLVLAVEAVGKHIQTIEGLAAGETLHPLQKAFIDYGAVQCGMCIPGMIMAGKALLDQSPHPTEAEVKEAMKGNFCRCTGYAKIIEAIRGAAGDVPPPRYEREVSTSIVHKYVPRVDAYEKVTGKAVYTIDMILPGMLYGEILRSPYPHARIRRIDTGRAKRHPGVIDVITAADCPPNKFGAFVQDETALAADTVRYVGDGVAAVCAVDPETALEALDLIEVEYDELPGVYDPEAAMQEGAPMLHEGVERNIVAHNKVVGGDIEKGFAQADHIFEDRFTTSRQCHACLEPHVVIADWDASGRLTLYMSTQSTFFHRFGLMGIFGIPASKIRIIAPYLGGGFGSKSEALAIDVCAIVFSKRTGRPVKMAHTRDEEFTSSRTRHPQVIYLKTGVKKDGTIMARQARVILDNGAYTSYGPGVSLCESMLGGALYKIPHYRYDGYTVYTNNPFGGAFRGFGSPQFSFAVECHTDMIAERLQMDPLEFRLKNLADPGYEAVSGPRLTTCGVKEALTKAAEAIGYAEKKTQKPPNRGVGLACGIHFTSGKFHPQVNADFCAAGVKVNEDGSVNVLTGTVEMGTGTTTVLSQIAAEELGVRIEDVEIINSDSETIPSDFGTYGSRVTTLGGNAVKIACERVKEQLFAVASEKLGVPANELQAKDRRIFWVKDPTRGLSIAETVQASLFRDRNGQQIMAQAHYDAPCDLPDPETGVGDFAQSYSFGVHAVEVEVDLETGKVKILNFVAATDCGNVINPQGAEGQVEGGAMQGIGYALMEHLDCPDGKPINPRFGTYKIPSVMEIPEGGFKALWVETNDPKGPYGAKGLGEMGLVPTAPALANAISDATGVRVPELPITPEKIVKGLKARTAKGS